MTVNLRIEGELRWRAHAFFSPNAYPAELRSRVDACGTRLFVVFCHAEAITRAVDTDRERFIRALDTQEQREPGSLRRLVTKHPDSIAHYEGELFLASLHGLFAGVKSFLDIYAQLMAGLVGTDARPAFRRAKVREDEIAGGRFINWLRNSAPAEFTASAAHADILEEHSRAWITKIVSLRDRLLHGGDLRELEHLRVALDSRETPYTVHDVRPPTLWNKSLVEVSGAVVHNIEELCRTTVQLFPNVDRSVLSLGTR